MNDWICPIWICLQGQLSKFLLALLACFFVQQKAPPVKYFLLPLALACLLVKSLCSRQACSCPVFSSASSCGRLIPFPPKRPQKSKKEKKRKEKKSKTPLKSLNPSR